MVRPLRIEYEHAFYHVMNRGKGRQDIFCGDGYFQAFLDTVGEAGDRFNAIIHCYCLMSNHYHLLVETPHANLGRIMRHINGVYTQRYNRMKKTDGPLFRGRYKLGSAVFNRTAPNIRRSSLRSAGEAIQIGNMFEDCA